MCRAACAANFHSDSAPRSVHTVGTTGGASAAVEDVGASSSAKLVTCISRGGAEYELRLDRYVENCE